MNFRLHAPTIIDFLAFIGLWKVWLLAFQDEIPLKWLRTLIFRRWPHDGFKYANLEEVPMRKSPRREHRNRKPRERLVAQVPDIGYYVPVWEPTEGQEVMSRGWMVNGQGQYVSDPETGQPMKARHPLAIRQGGYMVLEGEGNKITTAFNCPDCSPVWVMLLAVPAWCLWQRPVQVVGMAGFALMAGRLWESKKN